MSSNRVPERFRERSHAKQNEKTSRVGRSNKGLFLVLLLGGAVAFAAPSLRSEIRSKIADLPWKTSRINPTDLPDLPDEDFEVIALNDPLTLHALADLELRSKKISVRHFSGPNELFQDRQLTEELTAAGLMTASELKVPFVRYRGRFLNHEAYAKKMESLKPKYFTRESADNYVNVYGVNHCGFTKRLIESLKAKKIEFKYFDLNSTPDVGAKAEARLRASGYPFSKKPRTPIVEVNGMVFADPEIGEISKRFLRAPASTSR